MTLGSHTISVSTCMHGRSMAQRPTGRYVAKALNKSRGSVSPEQALHYWIIGIARPSDLLCYGSYGS